MKEHYAILKADTSADLEVLVNRACRSGWVPAGGVAVVCVTRQMDGEPVEELIFAQAVWSIREGK